MLKIKNSEREAALVSQLQDQAAAADDTHVALYLPRIFPIYNACSLI
jgi:hypothetical protein